MYSWLTPYRVTLLDADMKPVEKCFVLANDGENACEKALKDYKARGFDVQRAYAALYTAFHGEKVLV
jgi:hypothetical protein